MAETPQFTTLVGALNQALGGVTPYKLAVVDPAQIEPVDKNAHYMSQRVYQQLVDNIREDGNLSSLPFCWQRPDGRLVSLSGNHRVGAARDAGVGQILVLYTDQKLAKDEQIAVQLSHNALVGQDNPQALRELWNEITRLDAKVYSGLDEGLLETMPPVQVVRIDDAPLRMEELTMWFAPAEIERAKDVLSRIGHARKHRFLADVQVFDRFFDALLDFKEARGILNTATAILALLELAEQWLEQHDEHVAGEQEHDLQGAKGKG